MVAWGEIPPKKTGNLAHRVRYAIAIQCVDGFHWLRRLWMWAYPRHMTITRIVEIVTLAIQKFGLAIAPDEEH